MTPWTRHIHRILAITTLSIAVASSLFAQSWQFVTGAMTGAAISEEGIMLAVGHRGIVFRSENGGSSWSLPQSGTYRNLYHVAFASAARAVAVGDNGVILVSDDSGENWKGTKTGGSRRLIRLFFPTSEKGYILGSDSLYASDDAGESWHGVANVPQLPESFWFISESTGLLATYNGHIYRTTDSGRNWTEVYTDTSVTLRSIAFTRDGTTGFVCGPLGQLLRTSDSGQTWTSVSGPNPGLYPLNMLIRDDGLVLLAGATLNADRVVLQRSEDFGGSWENVPVEIRFTGFALFNICLNSLGHGIAVSNLGSVLRTDDDWRTYTTVTEPTHEFPGYGYPTFRRPAFATDRIGIIPNSLFPGGYIRTTDGGITWLTRQYAADRYSVPIFFSESEGLILRERPGLLYRTTDMGATWKPAIADADPSNGSVSDMRFFNRGHGLQTGYLLRPNRFGGTRSAIVYVTDDSAQTWTGTILDWPPDISGMALTYDRTALVSAGSTARDPDSTSQLYRYGRIYRTTDGGRSWDTIYDRYGKGVFPLILDFRTEQHGYMTVGGDDWGYPGKAVILETTDLGDTWNVLAVFDQTKGEYAPIDVEFFTDSIWYGVGSNASIMVTTDAGRTWEREVIDPLPTLYNDWVPTFHKITLLPDKRTAMIFGQGVMLRRVFPEPFSSVEDEKHSRDADGSLSVVPNPAYGEMRLVWRGSGRPVTARMYDVMGRDVLGETIFFGESGNTRIDASDLPTGTYRVVVYGWQGERLGSAGVARVR